MSKKELRRFLKDGDIVELLSSDYEPGDVEEEEGRFNGDEKERENPRNFESNNPEVVVKGFQRASKYSLGVRICRR